jgi:hypothetical protein
MPGRSPKRRRAADTTARARDGNRLIAGIGACRDSARFDHRFFALAYLSEVVPPVRVVVIRWASRFLDVAALTAGSARRACVLLVKSLKRHHRIILRERNSSLWPIRFGHWRLAR